MFSSLFRALAASSSHRPEAPDAARALAALMVRVARADGDYSTPERSGIERVLAARHGLSPAEAAAMRTEAETLEAEAGDTVRFTRVLKDQVPLETRAGLVEALWEVALADGSKGNDEAMTLRLMTSLLGISDTESGLARQRVLARMEQPQG